MRRLPVFAGRDNTIHVWDWIAQKAIQTMSGLSHPPGPFQISADNRRLFAVMGGNRPAHEIQVWGLDMGLELLTLPVSGPISRLALSPDGRRLAALDQNETVWIWDATN